MIYLRFGVVFLVIFVNYMRCDVDMMVRYVCAVTEKIVNADQDINDVAIGFLLKIFTTNLTTKY